MRTIEAYKSFSKPPPIIRPTQLIFHSACDNYDVNGHISWQHNGSLESHVIFSKQGDLYLITPYNRRAQANYTANGPRADGSGAISAETSSDINAEDPWTDNQLESMAYWAKQRMAEFGIAKRVCRNPTDSGIGFHTMWGAPSAWTPVAKTCPGPTRKKQFYSSLVPMILDGSPPPPPIDPPKPPADQTKDDEMALDVVRCGGVDYAFNASTGVFFKVRDPDHYFFLRAAQIILVDHGQARSIDQNLLGFIQQECARAADRAPGLDRVEGYPKS